MILATRAARLLLSSCDATALMPAGRCWRWCWASRKEGVSRAMTPSAPKGSPTAAAAAPRSACRRSSGASSSTPQPAAAPPRASRRGAAAPSLSGANGAAAAMAQPMPPCLRPSALPPLRFRPNLLFRPQTRVTRSARRPRLSSTWWASGASLWPSAPRSSPVPSCAAEGSSTPWRGRRRRSRTTARARCRRSTGCAYPRAGRTLGCTLGCTRG